MVRSWSYQDHEKIEKKNESKITINFDFFRTRSTHDHDLTIKIIAKKENLFQILKNTIWIFDQKIHFQLKRYSDRVLSPDSDYRLQSGQFGH